MSAITGRYRTFLLVVLLITTLVPRCLMAAEMVWMSPVSMASVHRMPCHSALSADKVMAGHITCALQCEQSLLSAKATDLQHPLATGVVPVAIVTTWPALTLLTPAVPHQGWPPDKPHFLPDSQRIYFETGRLRL